MDDSAYRCPITQDVMVDPVIAPDGHTYERWAIEEAMKGAAVFRSPMTNATFTSKRLGPNHFVRALIHGYMDGASEEVKAAWRASHAEVAAKCQTVDAARLFSSGKVAEAADLGNADAQASLAQHYYDAGDVETCVKYAEMLFLNGHCKGAYIAGMAYFRDHEYAAAALWFDECAREFPSAYYMLGLMEADSEEKKKHFVKGALAADPDCMFQVAQLSYAAKKFKDARKMFKRVAAQDTPRKYDAMFKLAGMYIQGVGGHSEYAQGHRLVEAAAEAGHPAALKLLRYNKEYDFD